MIEWLSTFLPESAPLIAGALGFVLTWFLLPVIIYVSHSKGLVDKPLGPRKLHLRLTPNLGGLAFYFSLVTIFFLSGYAQQPWTPYFFAGLTVLMSSGVKDDISVLSAKTKLFIQIGAVAALIFFGNVYITDLGGVFGFNEINHWAGMSLTGFTMIVVINAYNLIDGIDGLAGSVGLIALLFFGGWFWYVGYTSYAVLALIGVGSLGAFLRYNFQPATIFMGDTGSQVIGYLLAFFAVSFVKIGVITPVEVPFQNIIPILVLSVLIVPLYDTLRVFILRIFKKSSPFKADRLHVHHQLLDMGFTHRTVCSIIVFLNLSIIGLTLALREFQVNGLLAIVLGVSVILFPTMGIKRKIFRKMGMQFPSARHINILKKKYGVQSKSFDDNKVKKESSSDNDWDQVAV
jgi:UDP-N-acetylmuramyl pentapeptide phosphotransferase/UDP-N-acetylglucosamine-1-phosphate transferase